MSVYNGNSINVYEPCKKSPEEKCCYTNIILDLETSSNTPVSESDNPCYHLSEVDNTPVVTVVINCPTCGVHVRAVTTTGYGTAVPCDLNGTCLSASGKCDTDENCIEHTAVLESAVSDMSGPDPSCDAVLGEVTHTIEEG